MTSESPDRHGPSRRTVLRASAWAVPAVTLVNAAPAFANTSVTPTGFSITGSGTTSGGLTLTLNLNYVVKNEDLANDGVPTVTVTLPGLQLLSLDFTAPSGWTGSLLSVGNQLRFVGAAVAPGGTRALQGSISLGLGLNLGSPPSAVVTPANNIGEPTAA